MSDSLQFDFDVDEAWSSFQRRLGDYAAVMRDGDALVLESRYDSTDGDAGSAACVQLYAWADMLRCEIPSNDYLHPTRAVAGERRDTVLGMGFRPSSDSRTTAVHLDRNRSWADDVARVTVAVFRDVWGLAHPSFVRAHATGRYDVTEFESHPAAETYIVPRCVQPRDKAHLQQLVDKALEPWFGFPPEHDNDGDIPLRFAAGTAYVSVKPSEPVVEINSTLVHSVSGRTRAAELLVDLNLQLPDVMLHLVQDCVVAQVRVSGAPFVADHLLWAVRMLSHVWEQVDEKFAEDFGGILGEPKPPTVIPDEYPPGLIDLLTLVGDTGAPPDSEAVFECCLLDRDIAAGYLRISAEQEASWRAAAVAADLGDEDTDVDEADREAGNWRRAVTALREVLRMNPESSAPVVDPSAIQLQLFETEQTPEYLDEWSDEQ